MNRNRPRIALLNVAHDPGRPSRNFHRVLAADIEEFRAVRGELPPPPSVLDVDGVVVTGSRSSVYWDEDWIPPTKTWVGAAIDDGLPHLGICFGHQLLADVLGGTVEDMGTHELGYRTVTHRSGHLFTGIEAAFLVFTSHSDAVTELPPGAVCTAENDRCIHGFRMNHVFGLQSHPEYDMNTATRITREKPLPEDRIQRVLDGITERNYRRAAAAKQVFDNFLGYVRGSWPMTSKERQPSGTFRRPTQ